MIPGLKLVRELGRGSMGVVYQAVQLSLQRDVAVKVIGTALSGDPKEQVRFEREARALAMFDHPGIVRIFDSGMAGGQLYYVMELLQGTDLWQHVYDCGPLPLVEAIAAVAQAADALCALHEAGLTHRDVKPSNLFLEDGGRVVLTDLGLMRNPRESHVTQGGHIVGSPRFVPPEAVLRQPVGPPQDVWALAITLHELVTGKGWTPSQSVTEVLKMIVTGPPPDLARAGVVVPEWLLALQRAALTADPAQRISAAEYRDRLRAHADGQGQALLASAVRPGLATMRLAPPRAEASRPRRHRPRRPHAAVLAGAAGLMLLAAIGTWRAMRPVPSPVLASAALPRADDAAVWASAPRPCGHRALEVWVDAAVPEDARVEARDGAQPVADARPGPAVRRGNAVPARRVVLGALPPERTLELAVVAGGRTLGTRSVRTPPVVPVVALSCWPSERDVIVDFELRDPVPCTVEVVRAGGERPVFQDVLPRGRIYHRVIKSLAPLTDYVLRVRLEAGWGGMGDYPFTTLSPLRERELAAWLSQMQSPTLGGWFSQLDARPDARMGPAFRELLPAVTPTHVQSLRRMAALIGQLQDREVARLLGPFVDRLPAEESASRAAVIEAMARARCPEAAGYARAWIERSTDPAALSACSFALAEGGGREGCDLILGAIARAPARAELIRFAVQTDAAHAFAAFRRWLEPGGTPPLARAAAAGLAELGEPAVDELLAVTARPGAPAEVVDAALDALATIPSPRTAPALAAACRAAPADPHRMWLATRAGCTEVVRSITGQLQSPATAWDAACALGLLDAPEREEALRAAAQGADTPVARAALWALVRGAEPDPARAREAAARLRDLLAGAPSRRDAVRAALESLRPDHRRPGERVLLPVTPWERTGLSVLPGDTLVVRVDVLLEPHAGPRPQLALVIGAQRIPLSRGNSAHLVTRAGEVLIAIDVPPYARGLPGAIHRVSVKRGE